MDIILGSSSPRRKNIIENLVDKFTIVIPDIVEDISYADISPEKYCRGISKKKGGAVLSNISKACRNNESIIICCDTIVAFENEIIGKPVDFNDAVKILRKLSGKEHKVISSITLIFTGKSVKLNKTESETSTVKFRPLSDPDITKYLNLINFKDKAGAYAIQEHGELLIESTSGSLTNIIGFPLRLFFKMLQSMNLLYILTV